MAKTIKTAREKKLEKELKKLKLFHYQQAAQKAYLDYMVLRTISCSSLEPENFLSKWARQFVPEMLTAEKKAFWQRFMQLLVNRGGPVHGNVLR